MKQPLTIIRGTTQTITIAVKNDDGTAYTLADGETLRFGVKRHPEDADSLCLVKKSLTAASLDNGLYVAFRCFVIWKTRRNILISTSERGLNVYIIFTEKW